MATESQNSATNVVITAKLVTSKKGISATASKTNPAIPTDTPDPHLPFSTTALSRTVVFRDSCDNDGYAGLMEIEIRVTCPSSWHRSVGTRIPRRSARLRLPPPTKKKRRHDDIASRKFVCISAGSRTQIASGASAAPKSAPRRTNPLDGAELLRSWGD